MIRHSGEGGEREWDFWTYCENSLSLVSTALEDRAQTGLPTVLSSHLWKQDGFYVLSVSPFLSSLTMLLSPFTRVLFAWTRSIRGEQVHLSNIHTRPKTARPICHEPQRWSPSGDHSRASYAFPIHKASSCQWTENTLFLLPMCLLQQWQTSHFPALWDGNTTQLTRERIPLLPPGGNSKPAQDWQEMSIYWDTRGNDFPKFC